jgi:hypothetical protein
MVVMDIFAFGDLFRVESRLLFGGECGRRDLNR